MVVIEFPDGLHEYVTTPVKRVLKVCGGRHEVYYIQTANSKLGTQGTVTDAPQSVSTPND